MIILSFCQGMLKEYLKTDKNTRFFSSSAEMPGMLLSIDERPSSVLR